MTGQVGRPAAAMPGFATTTRTLDQARRLMAAIGCSAGEIDIRPSCEHMLADIGHPYSRGEPVYDIAFENVLAGERTSHLLRLANFHGGFVVGTGDPSELALGWCTYGIGDRMSHYNVNASVPKTLIKHLWSAGSRRRPGARRDPRDPDQPGEAIARKIASICEPLGHRVHAVANYEGFVIDTRMAVVEAAP